MFLNKFYSGNNDCITITAEQGSLFAKEIANDFNPLHDVDSKRFCVPGDLLFALILNKYGLNKKMEITFTGMLGHGVLLNLPETNKDQFDINGSHHKTIVRVDRKGELTQDMGMINTLIQNYVAFSGHNFPYVLVPLMAEQNVMINLARPLVIYESMTLEFNRLDFSDPQIDMLPAELSVNGKRGDAYFNFDIKSGNDIVGKGFKKIVISGIKAYEEGPMQEFVDNYLVRKEAYLSAG
jgi:hypothetical protein